MNNVFMIRNIDNSRHYQAKFNTWLLEKDYSKRSVKNYLFDVSLYLGLKSKEETMYEGVSDLFSSRAIQSFVESIKSTGSSEATVNRRLAGIQLFLNFLIGEKVLSSNPIKTDELSLRASEASAAISSNADRHGPSDLAMTLSHFEKYLVTSGLSKSTTGDYVADVMEFLEVVDPRIREDDKDIICHSRPDRESRNTVAL